MTERVEGQLTVRALVALLLTVSQDNPVWVEGCDCDQEAATVEEYDGLILIRNVGSLRRLGR